MRAGLEAPLGPSRGKNWFIILGAVASALSLPFVRDSHLLDAPPGHLGAFLFLHAFVVYFVLYSLTLGAAWFLHAIWESAVDSALLTWAANGAAALFFAWVAWQFAASILAGYGEPYSGEGTLLEVGSRRNSYLAKIEFEGRVQPLALQWWVGEVLQKKPKGTRLMLHGNRGPTGFLVRRIEPRTDR